MITIQPAHDGSECKRGYCRGDIESAWFKVLRVVDPGVFPGCAEGDHHGCLYDGGKLSGLIKENWRRQ
jgi:hypothetical protein